MHGLNIASWSKLGQFVQGESVRVNSAHRGGLDGLGQGLVATAWAEDGTIEAVESREGGWVHGVLFHPEEMARADRTWLKLFEDFVKACRASASSEDPSLLSQADLDPVYDSGAILRAAVGLPQPEPDGTAFHPVSEISDLHRTDEEDQTAEGVA